MLDFHDHDSDQITSSLEFNSKTFLSGSAVNGTAAGYLHSLHMLKRSFRNGSERHWLSSKLKDRFPGGQVSVLDVGIGDGSFTRKILMAAGINFNRLQLTAIEPELDARVALEQEFGFGQFRLISKLFQNVDIPRGFDLVLSIHSLYYLGNPATALQRLVDSAKPGGLIVIVAWSAECDLYKLHKRLASQETEVSINSQAVRSWAEGYSGVRLIAAKSFRGTVDFSGWLSDDQWLRAACGVLSRRPLSHLDCDETLLTWARQMLQEMPGLRGTRVNEAILLETM